MDNNIVEAIKLYIQGISKKESKDLDQVKLSSFLAGMIISIGAFVSVNVGTGLPVGLSKLLSGIVFSSALIMIVLLGLELFTGNVLSLFKYIRKPSLEGFFKLWWSVYIWNFAGCLVGVTCIELSGLSIPLQEKLTDIALAKCSLTFIQAFTRGILCNMLVCTAILIANEAKTIQGKIFGIMVPITVFIASGYEHSIANMFFLPIGHITIGQLLHNIIPVTLGNIVGGLLIALILLVINKEQINEEKKLKED